MATPFLRMIAAFVMLELAFACPGPQAGEPDGLVLEGDVQSACRWSISDLAALPRVSVTVSGESQSLTYQGVSLASLLDICKVSYGDAVRRRDGAKYLLAQGRDGYVAVFSLVEIAGNDTLVADSRDGRPLATDEGPLRLVATGDPARVRWIKQLSALKIRTSAN
jgi:DMSO/TMAO reductase YedYZ molybdopterin-dependent catalytic subunit